MVAQNRLHGPYSHNQGQVTPGSANIKPLPLAKIQKLLAKAARAGLKAGPLTVFLVLLIHSDALGGVSARTEQIAEETNLKPDSVRHILGELRTRGELEVVRAGAGKRPPLWRIARLRV